MLLPLYLAISPWHSNNNKMEIESE